jgi:hypothetical protein
MRTYTATNGHQMAIVSTRTDAQGHEVPDYWNAMHSTTCSCLTSEDW